MKKAERDWLRAETEPFLLLLNLQNQFDTGGRRQRKVRLFACACCRRLWRWLPDPRSRHAVEVTERFADGEATYQQRAAAEKQALAAANNIHNVRGSTDADESTFPYATRAAWWTVLPTNRLLLEEVNCGLHPAYHYSSRVLGHTLSSARQYAEATCLDEQWQTYRLDELQRRRDYFQKRMRDIGDAAQKTEGKHLCDLLRDLYRNPYRRPPRIDPGWQTPDVSAIAQTIYEERSFQDMPILADALEEAGCTNVEILNHCRQPGEHVRGCWVVDLILGKD